MARTARFFKYTFRIEFRRGGSAERFATATSQAEARRDLWCSLDNPERTVRRIDFVSKVPTELYGQEARDAAAANTK